LDPIDAKRSFKKRWKRLSTLMYSMAKKMAWGRRGRGAKGVCVNWRI
jgi:hypothetical protein